MKLGLIFILSIISKFCLTQEKNNYVMLSLTRGMFGYAIEYHIGKDKIRVDSMLDLVNDDSYMSNKKYLNSENFPQNKYISEGFYRKNDNKIPFKVYTDVISFDNEITINDFQFITFNVTTPPFKDSISLSYASVYNKNSFVNMLYNNGYISKKKVFVSKEERTVYIGNKNIPQKTNSSYSTGTCSIYHNKWGCQFYSMTLENKTIINNNYYVEIDSNENNILLPKELFKQFEQILFKKYIDNKTCTYSIFYTQYRFICYCNILRSISTLELGIGYNIFSFEGRKLFLEYEDFCIMNIMESDYENIILGRDFISEYSIELDYESKKLSFISNKLNITRNNLLYIRWYMLNTIIFTLIFGISILIINYNLHKNSIVI